MAEVGVTTEEGDPMEEEEGVEELLRSKECAKTVRRMWLLSSVLTVSLHWCFVMTVQLYSIEEQEEEITS